MFNEIIHRKAKEWLASPDCKIKLVVEYIRQTGHLREPQIEAIEVYLFLKIAGENKPLWQLLSEGFLSDDIDLDRLNLAVEARENLKASVSARSIFEFVRKQSGNTTSVPSPNENLIADNAANLDFVEISKKIFYGVSYNDYLLSLPMGAGKTFLMAAIMYLDLYFADNEPENKLFAHNFLVLVPSGLKSSIVPSLKTIEKFDPTWVIPEPAASKLKQLIKFEVLDEAKSASKSNKAKNPNVQKIARHTPIDDQIGLILIVNAEKVILDHVDLDAQGNLYEQTDDEKGKLSNELRRFIGFIPNLQIHMDEVQRTTRSEIKLRQVVNKWSSGGNVNGVLGYSGTPYLDSNDQIPIGDLLSLNSKNITNTVYYYPLVDAIKTFLKKTLVRQGDDGMSSLEIVRQGVKEFREAGRRDTAVRRREIRCQPPKASAE